MNKQIAFIAGIGVIAYLSLIPTAQFNGLTGSVVKILGLSLNDQFGGITVLKWIHYFGHFGAYFIMGMLIYNWREELKRRRLLIGLAGLFVFSLILEGSQVFWTDRQCSLDAIVMNLAGLAAAAGTRLR